MSSSSSSDSEPPGEENCNVNWLELPSDVTAKILQRLGAIDVLKNVQKVCTAWRKICKDPAMWRVIDMHNLGDLWDMDCDLEKMAKHAVDLSCGQLVDINIEYFGSDDLIDYISDRSSQLRRLQLVCCYGNFSSEALTEAFKKLPLLEELHLYYTDFTKEDIEVAGRCCPLLKSFKLNQKGYKRPHIECNEDALAVAENMPELRHLQLFGNKMTNDGLQAILDNCPHLEYLDLRQCFNLCLEGDLGKRCSERITDLRRPYDSTEGYGFSTDIVDWESSDGGYPAGFSDIDYESDYDNYFEGSDFSDYEAYHDAMFNY